MCTSRSCMTDVEINVQRSMMEVPETATAEDFNFVQMRILDDTALFMLTYNRLSVVLVVTDPGDDDNDGILNELFAKIDKVLEDNKEDDWARCLAKPRREIISVCKDEIRQIWASLPMPDENQWSLEHHINPPQVVLQVFSSNGVLGVYQLDDEDSTKYGHVRILDYVRLESNIFSKTVHTFISTTDLKFVEDLFANTIVKVLHGDKICVFKTTTQGNEARLVREIQTLERISQKWEPGEVDHPDVPRILGIVTSKNFVVGFLEEYIEGGNLYYLDMGHIPLHLRHEWRLQIERTITLLHQNDMVWGDAKPESVIIDKKGHAWLINFGGGWTEGWVDEALAETVEGDLQGVQRMVEWWDMVLEERSAINILEWRAGIEDQSASPQNPS